MNDPGRAHAPVLGQRAQRRFRLLRAEILQFPEAIRIRAQEVRGIRRPPLFDRPFVVRIRVELRVREKIHARFGKVSGERNAGLHERNDPLPMFLPRVKIRTAPLGGPAQQSADGKRAQELLIEPAQLVHVELHAAAANPVERKSLRHVVKR